MNQARLSVTLLAQFRDLECGMTTAAFPALDHLREATRRAHDRRVRYRDIACIFALY
jgi:hypothetical protein